MIAVDIGNTMSKFGYFSCQSLRFRLPKPESCIRFLHSKKKTVNGTRFFDGEAHKSIKNWLLNKQDCNDWYIAVTASGCNKESLIDELKSLKPDGSFRILTNDDVPIKTNVDFPSQIGIDRLLGAFAGSKFINDLLFPVDSTNADRTHNIETIIVIDAGTAITIDLVRINTNPAIFEGGAILSGLKTLSVTLNQTVSRLPEVNVSDFKSTDLIYPAKNTESAISTGILGSQIAAINFFIQRVKSTEYINAKTDKNKNNEIEIPIVFTGGDATIISELFNKEYSNKIVSSVPNLVLVGIALIMKSTYHE
ncbi:MAG: type III pantothenate kinase [Planctomycetaceae bacterium]|jgi:pantothenate kinase type III|nr:type III pantothenate kinase [Planctomycetaceae bacterium]